MNRVRLSAILIAGLFAACGSKSAITPDGGGGSGGHAAGGSGVSGAAGALPDAASPAGAAGAEPDASGAGGAAGGDGAITSADADGDTPPTDGTDDAADSSGDDGGAAGADAGGASLLAVAPTMGCGTDPGTQTGVALIDTMGIKDANCADTKCGPWMYVRQYYLRLPANYDRNKVYPLVFEPISCGGMAINITFLPAAVDDTVIRVGMGPPPNDIGHATNPGQNCPDNAEGDDSVDWVFYEKLHDRLAARLCFDRNRVFALGVHHGGTSADQLACRYAGDATHPIRGVLSDGGGLWTDPPDAPPHPQRVPTCTNKPLAGIWMDGKGNTTIPFTFAMTAIAMKVNGCTIGTGFLDAMFEPFPIGGNQPDGTCNKVIGCPEIAPIIVCALNNNQSSNPVVRDPGFTTFLKLFENPPLGAPKLP